ncbi:hypothetical protein [Trueperella pyogenes]|uniref:hypothetical protein n=1 Tax=Trueperella pyogenes TaxID=1661 RepID=UPI00345DE4BF
MTTQSRWGRTPKGRKTMPIAIPLGILLSLIVVGLLTLIRGLGETGAGTYFVVLFAVTMPLGIALVWVVIVDRSTIEGAIANPEVSIESHWHRNAARTGFFAVNIASSWGAAIAGACDWWEISLTLLGVAIFGAVVFAVAYAIQKRRGS